MTSTTVLVEEIAQNTLPPVICSNPRRRIDPEEVDADDIKLKSNEKVQSSARLVDDPAASPLLPIAKYPLTLVWNPGQLTFEINEDPVLNVLSIWNGCPRSIYIHCCGFWDETVRFGATWSCQPRTRFHLAPGMVSRLTVKATPRNHSPVPIACAGLQLASSHMRDHVVGYFVVPILVKFLNYKPPLCGEGE